MALCKAGWGQLACRSLSVVLLTQFGMGCSGKGGGGAGGDGAVLASDGGLFPPGDGYWAASCSSGEGCPDGRVCHPQLLSCVAPGEGCATHAQCTNGTYCDTTLGVCLEGVTGSPCGTSENCDGTCMGGVCGCDGIVHERQLVGARLDVYLIMDRTGSMGDDCDYTAGNEPPVRSKACYATYALSDYLIGNATAPGMRLAFQFMSQRNDCDGQPYETPLAGLTPLPVSADHAIIRAISEETFVGGLGTHIEGALRGLASYTAAHLEPGREIIGVLLTDGDPNGCEERIDRLRQIIASHESVSGIATYIIGMTGADERNLEQLAIAGGAESHTDWCGSVGPPCHYWNVGDGSGDAIASALQAIVQMAEPLPCHFDVADLEPPAGEVLDFGKVNVTLTEGDSQTTIGQVASSAACPDDQPAWYYDNAVSPTQIHLCPHACALVEGAGEGARVNAVVGCRKTVTLY